MTYYVQKRDFYAGDVADADHLMREFFEASNTIQNVDQNNIASDAIHHTVAIPPNSATTADRQRSPFACYNDTQLLFKDGLVVPYTSMQNGKYVEATVPLTFTSRYTGIYTFFMQAIAFRDSAHTGPLKVDATVRLNGSAVEGMQASFSADRTSGDIYVPVFFSASTVLYPNDWTVVPAFRCRIDDSSQQLPDILSISFGVAGFIR